MVLQEQVIKMNDLINKIGKTSTILASAKELY